MFLNSYSAKKEYLIKKKIKLIKYIYIDNFIIYNDIIIGVRTNNLNIYINEKFTIDNSIKDLQSEINKIKKIINSKQIKKQDIKYILTRFFNLEITNLKNNKSVVLRIFGLTSDISFKILISVNKL